MEEIRVDCPICGEPMEHVGHSFDGRKDLCVHWVCHRHPEISGESGEWNWPAGLEPEEDCPVCYS